MFPCYYIFLFVSPLIFCLVWGQNWLYSVVISHFHAGITSGGELLQGQYRIPGIEPRSACVQGEHSYYYLSGPKFWY